MLSVRLTAHCFRQSGQEVVANFQAVALAFEAAIDNPQLLLRSDLGVAAILRQFRAYLDSELESLLVILEIQERSEMGREHVCTYQHFDGEIRHETELVLDESRAEGDG